MKTISSLYFFRGKWYLFLLAVHLLGGSQNTRAFTVLDQAAAFSAWTNAFYYTSGDNGCFRVQEGTGNAEYFWQWAYDIDAVVRAQKIGLASTDMVNQACAGFTNSYGMDWSWNVWNDDLMAVARMFIDPHEVMGNTLWLARAKYAFDLSYNRGLDTVTTNAAAPGTNSITVRVTNNDTPPLSDAKTFSVFVFPWPRFTWTAVEVNGQAQLQFSTLPGQDYQLQYKTNVTDASWTTLGGIIPGAGLPLTVSDNSSSGFQRYYRLLAMPL